MKIKIFNKISILDIFFALFLLGGIIIYAGFAINGISIIVFVARYIINIVRQKSCSSAEIFEANNHNFKQIFKKDLYRAISFIIGLIFIIYTAKSLKIILSNNVK